MAVLLLAAGAILLFALNNERLYSTTVAKVTAVVEEPLESASGQMGEQEQ